MSEDGSSGRTGEHFELAEALRAVGPAASRRRRID